MAATAAAAAACVLADIQYSVALRGWVAEVTVRQRFCNTGDAPLEAEYACPLDPRAALTRLELSVGGRSVRAVSRLVGDAEDAYDDAVAAGRRGVMAAPGAHSGELRLTIGVVQPRDDVLVTLSYLTQLSVDSSDAAAGTTTYAMAVPLTSLPRCGGGGGGAAKSGAGASLTPAAAAAEAAYNVGVRVSLGAGVASAASPSHGVRFEEGATTTFVPERDLIIQCTSTGTSTGNGVVVAATRDDAAPPAMRYAVALRVAEAAAQRRPAEGESGGVVVLVDAGEDEHTAAEARRFATELLRALPAGAAVATVDAAAANGGGLEALLRLPSADAVAQAGRLRAAPHATDAAFARALAAAAAAGCDAVVVAAAAAPMLATREACAAARGFAAAGGGGVHVVGVGPTVNRAAVEEVAAAAVEGGGCGGGSVSYVSANEAVRAKVRRIAEAVGRRPTAVVGAGLEVEEVGGGSAAVVLAFAPEGTEHAEVACGGWSERLALDEAVARCGGGDVALHALVAAARVRRLEGAGRMREAAETAAAFGLPSRGTALVAVDTAVVAGSQFGVQLETVPVPRPAGLAQKHVPSAAGARVDPRACDTRARAVGVVFEQAAPEEPSVGTESYDGDDSRTGGASEASASSATSGALSPVQGRAQVAKEALRAPLALSQKLYKTLSSSQATQASRQLEEDDEDDDGGASDQQPDAQQQRVQQLDPDRHGQQQQQQQQQQSQDQRLQPVGPQTQLQQPQPPDEQRFKQLQNELQQLDPDPQNRFQQQQQFQEQRFQQGLDPQTHQQQSQNQQLQQLDPDRPSQLVQQQQQFQDQRFQQLGLDPQSQQIQDQRLQQLDPDPQSRFQQQSQEQLQQLDPDRPGQLQQQQQPFQGVLGLDPQKPQFQDQRLQQLDPDPQSQFQQQPQGGLAQSHQPQFQDQRLPQLDPDPQSPYQQQARLQQLDPDRPSQLLQQQQQFQDQRFQQLGLDPQSQQIQDQRLQQLDPDPQSPYQQQARLQQLDPDRPSQLVQQQQFQDQRFQQLGLDQSQLQQPQFQDQRLQQPDPDPQSQFQQPQTQHLPQLGLAQQSQPQFQDQRLPQLDPDPQSAYQQQYQTQQLQQLDPDRPSQLLQQQPFQDQRFQQLGLEPQRQQQQQQSQVQQLQQLDLGTQSSTQQHQAVLQPEATQDYDDDCDAVEAEETLEALPVQPLQEASAPAQSHTVHRPSASARPVTQTQVLSKTATPQKANKISGKQDRSGDAARRSERRSDFTREAAGPQQRARRGGGRGEAAVQPAGVTAPGAEPGAAPAAPAAPASASAPQVESKKAPTPKKKSKKTKESDEKPRGTLSSRLRASLGFGNKAKPAADAEEGEVDIRHDDGGGGGGFFRSERSKGQVASRSAFSEAVYVCDEVRSALARLQKNKQSAEAWYDLAMLLDEGGTVTIDGRTMTKAAILAKAISLAPYDAKIYLALCDCIAPGESATMEDGTQMTERELRSLGAAVMQTC